jgi:hypothetical protein
MQQALREQMVQCVESREFPDEKLNVDEKTACKRDFEG